MARPDATLADLARHRHGLFTTRLALDVGVTRGELRARAKAGAIVACYDHIANVGTVWRVASSLRTPEQSALAAVLAAGDGAMAAGRTSAWLWDVELPGHAPIEISVPRSRAPRLPGVSVSRPVVGLDRRPVRRRDVPTSNPLLLLIELGAVAPELVSDALEQLLADQRITLLAVHDLRRRHAQRGHAGVGVLAEVLVRRALGDKPPDSVLEVAMAELLVAGGLPALTFHHVVHADGRRFEVDFALPELRLAVEVDGIASHGGRRAFEIDRERDAVLSGAGWQVVRFTWVKVKRRPAWVADRLRAVITARRALLGKPLVA